MLELLRQSPSAACERPSIARVQVGLPRPTVTPLLIQQHEVAMEVVSLSCGQVFPVFKVHRWGVRDDPVARSQFGGFVCQDILLH
jgi:hypothetical protein